MMNFSLAPLIPQAACPDWLLQDEFSIKQVARSAQMHHGVIAVAHPLHCACKPLQC
jgi:hypothetical protein